MSDAPSVRPETPASPSRNNQQRAMSTPTTTSTGPLPDYIASAKPNPPTNRAPWYKNTAPTYAGIFLWFVFWDSIAGNGADAGRTGGDAAGDRAGRPDLPLPVLPGAGPAGQEDRAAALHRRDLDLRRDGRAVHARVADGRAPVRLAGRQHVRSGRLRWHRASRAPWLFYPLCVIWAVGAAFVGLEGHPVRRQGRHVPAADPAGGPAARTGALRRLGASATLRLQQPPSVGRRAHCDPAHDRGRSSASSPRPARRASTSARTAGTTRTSRWAATSESSPPSC